MNSKSFQGSFKEFHHCNTSISSDDWVPDSEESILASETEYSIPGSSYILEKALNKSGILPNLKSVLLTSPSEEHNACTSHNCQWLLLIVPPSPNKSEQNYEHINEIATAMMELQVIED